MRIAIVTSGRFHVLDLARELDLLGHDVRFYSMLDRRRTRAHGLPDRCQRWLGPLPGALALGRRSIARFGRSRFTHALDVLLATAIDRLAERAIEPCDVVIGMSGMTDRTLRRAKSKFGGVTICERSSQHILAQRDILRAMPGRPLGAPDPIPPALVEAELRQYDEADYISLLSRHVVRSFTTRGVARDRLIRNPLGSDLELFRPTHAPPPDRRRIIMAGTWSLQKGCDLLADAWRIVDGRQRTELVHVGSRTDTPLPTSEPRFRDLGFVLQRELPVQYSDANVFCLPSRQDGFGIVLVQALACGLRVVCSENTGGEDLAELLDDPSVVTVVPVGDVKALADALERALDAAAADTPGRDLLGSARERLTWAAYARRWDDHLKRVVAT